MITKSDALLLKLSYMCQAYRKDFLSMYDDYSNNNSKALKALLDKNYISIRKIPIVGTTKEVEVVAITYEGRMYLANKYDDEEIVIMVKHLQKQWNSNDAKVLNRKLTDNRLVSMIVNAGANVFPYEKPSLPFLLKQMESRSPVTYEDSPSEIASKLDEGIYYSSLEIKRAIEVIKGKAEYDSIMGARFRGVYVDTKQIIMCYVSNIAKNQMLRLSYNVEQRAVRIISDMFSLLNNQTQIKAIVLSAGNALTEKMCSKVLKGDIENYSLLDWNNDLFSRIYVIPHSRLGADSLNYLFTHDYDSWKEDSYILFDNFSFAECIKVNIANELLLGRNSITGHRMMFVPYYDTQLLKFIKEFYEDIDIICRQDMVDTMAHIINRNNSYYDLSGNELYTTPANFYLHENKKRITHMKPKSVNLSNDTIASIKLVAKVTGKTSSSVIRSAILEYLKIQLPKAEAKLAEETMLRKKMRKKF